MSKPKLLPIDLPPGLYRNGTAYQSKGRWYDANGVRFIENTIRPIGGWRRAPDASGEALATLSGVPRGAIGWRDDSGAVFIAVGTTSKLYVIAGGTAYNITPNLFTTGRVDTAIPGTGSAGAGDYGAGLYGSGAFGVGSSLGIRNEADTWQLDTFGNYLVAVASSTRKLYSWDGNTSNLAASPAGAPSIVTGLLCTPERFLVALGADGNRRKVQWASQESLTDWTATASNSAGDFELATPGAIICGARTRRDSLIWTDADLHTMSYIGGELIYRFDQAGKGCGIVSPRAYAVTDSFAAWMSQKGFYTYDGYVKKIPCDVHDEVFTNFNESQIKKVWAQTIAQYGEIWWFYPSASSTECDRYVVYNYIEQHWTLGRLPRTAGFDADASPNPIMLSPNGEIFEHEIGEDRHTPFIRITEEGDTRITEDGFVRGTEGEDVFLESGPFEIGDGDNVVSVTGIVPDERTSGDVDMTFYSAMTPMGTETARGPYSLADETSVRFTTRQSRIRLTEVVAEAWRVGKMRLWVRLGGIR